METLRRMLRVLDDLMHPDGYNIGLNLGHAAGAGLPGHLHWHVVPRWHGDTNFMPLLADTKVIVQSLEALLPKNPRFIGLVGSRRHTGHHLEALRAKGVEESVIERIQSPVGLDIGAVTPAEIALSVIAGLVASRRGRQGGWLQNR